MKKIPFVFKDGFIRAQTVRYTLLIEASKRPKVEEVDDPGSSRRTAAARSSALGEVMIFALNRPRLNAPVQVVSCTRLRRTTCVGARLP